MDKEEYKWRTRNMNPQYKVGVRPEIGTGLYSINKETDEVCDCNMVWNEEGTLLYCPVCGFDGT